MAPKRTYMRSNSLNFLGKLNTHLDYKLINRKSASCLDCISVKLKSISCLTCYCSGADSAGFQLVLQCHSVNT